jgi:aspartyl-tRNA(Asn)/glutamyl-tRNA(Gln) amidotransferase subunit C
MEIKKETIKHLAELSRIKLTEKEEEHLLKDLLKIINHFQELEEIDTSKVLPINGGTNNLNIFREDNPENPYQCQGKESFPENKKGFLNIPSVF